MNKTKSQTAGSGKAFFIYVIFGERRKQSTGLKESVSLLATSRTTSPALQA